MAPRSKKKTKGTKRFVFKSFTQRLEEVDIDVYRSLEPIKFQPTEGCSFFHEGLVRWRELNAATDFIAVYEKLFPLVQTLPLLLLHKETIVEQLLSCLHPTAALSLEPILSLVAVLARDLDKEYLQYMPRIFERLANLLHLGGDRNSDILEQTFTCISYIFKYMLKHLVKDLVSSLKMTRCLRYFRQLYVRDFAAEAVSFLMRNALVKDLIKGVRQVISEAESDPVEEKLTGCSALLLYSLKGPSNTLHSRAEEIIRILLNESILAGDRRNDKNGETVLKITDQTFSLVREGVQLQKLDLLWSCLVDELSDLMCRLETSSPTCSQKIRLMQLLVLLNGMLEFRNGSSVKDYNPLLALAKRLMQLGIFQMDELSFEHVVVCLRVVDPKQPSVSLELWQNPLLSEAFRFLLGLLRNHSQVAGASIGSDAISAVAPSWDSVFESNIGSCVLSFISGILKLKKELVTPFQVPISKTLERFSRTRLPEVLPLYLDLMKKQLGITPSDDITSLVLGLIQTSLQSLKERKGYGNLPITPVTLWTALQCVPYLVDSKHKSSLLCLEYATTIDEFVDELEANEKAEVWEPLLGAALSSHTQVHDSDLLRHVGRVLDFGFRHPFSWNVLEAVADCLEVFSANGGRAQDLNSVAFRLAAKTFGRNLGHPSKRLRMATLRVLRSYEPVSDEEQVVSKRFKGNDGKPHDVLYDKVMEDLLAVESSPLDVEHSRQICSYISQMKMHVQGKRISSAYLSLVLEEMIGMLHNPFTPVWDPAADCLVVLMENCGENLSDEFLECLSVSQERYLTNEEFEVHDHSPLKDLVHRWRVYAHDSGASTSTSTILMLLLQVAQKFTPALLDSKCWKLVSMFLTFVDDGNKSRRGRMGWKSILKEWLRLLKLLKNIRGSAKGEPVKEVIFERLLMYSDGEIQELSLDCLLNWRDKYLTSYEGHLRNLITVDTLRDELVSWNISREGQEVADEHRKDLIPLLLKILYPKVVKKAGKSAAKFGQRKAVLTFLAQLDSAEVAYFIILLLRPLKSAFSTIGWEEAIQVGVSPQFVKSVDVRAVADLPIKRKIGFLHLVKQILDTFDGDHLEPYLHALLALVLRLLEVASVTDTGGGRSSTDVNVDGESYGITGLGEIRGICLRIMSLVFSKFVDVEFAPWYWDIFFRATKHSVEHLKEEQAHQESPSALLSCFLAMSQSLELAPFLARSEVLVPNLFSILSIRSVSLPVQASIIRFIENIIGLGDHELVQNLLVPHLYILLPAIGNQFAAQNSKRERMSKHIVKDHLHILCCLSEFIRDPLEAGRLLDVLLPYLRKKKNLDAEICMAIITIINNLSPILRTETVSKCLEAFAPLLATMSSQEIRTSISISLNKLTHADASLVDVAEIISDLNSVLANSLGEFDDDRRVNAYGRLNNQFFFRIEPAQASLIFSHVIFDMSSDSLVLRQSASNCLLSAVAQPLLLGCPEKQGGKGLSLNDFLFSHVKRAMASQLPSIRREWLLVFREMVKSSEKLKEYLCLTNSDLEQDFFHNIVHIQIHRRIRAMTKFRELSYKGHFSKVALTKIFAPMFTHFLFEPRGDKGGNLVEAGVESLGCIASRLPWASYVDFLMESFRLLAAKPEHQKVLVRLICTIIAKIQYQRKDKLEDIDIGEKSAELPSKVTETLQRTVLPEISKLMLKKDSLNVPVILAMAKVLKLMPNQIIEAELPRVLQTVINLLKNRSQDIRNEARAGLVTVAETLGADYLQFIVKMLQSSLRRGYERHVMGYTVNAVLSGVLPKSKVGDIDYVAEYLLAILEKEIFGEVFEEKDVEALANKMKETKQIRSFDSLRLISGAVTFGSCAVHLLKPVKTILQQPVTVKAEAKIRTVLKHVSMGIQGNSSASTEQVLVFVHGLVDGFVKEQATICKGKNMEKVGGGYLLCEFALELLFGKVHQLSKCDAKMVAMLNPFVGLLKECLLAKYDGVLSGALRCLSYLVRLPLPATEAMGKSILSSIFAIAEGSGSTENRLIQESLKLLAVVLRHCKGLKISEDQIHELLHLPVFIELENQTSGLALSLLKSVVERKLLVPEIYDLINRVQVLMITSHAEAVRSRCSKVFLQFLLDYPLGVKRLQQHIDFLLKHLEYEHETGREAALEMLHTVIVKFPEAIIKDQADTFFVTLVTRLANDKSSHVRSLLATVLKVLMGRLDSQCLQRIVDFSLSWINGSKRSLWLPGAQVTGLLIEVMDESFERYVDSVLLAAMNILKFSSYGEGEEEETEHWHYIYFTLSTIEKLLERFPKLDLEWALLSNFLLHRHMWIRKVCGRIFLLHFREQTKECSDGSWLLWLAACFCEQVDATELDEPMSEEIVENLSLVSRQLHSIRLSSLRDDERTSKALSMLSSSSNRNNYHDDANMSALILVFWRLEKIALRVHPVQAMCVLKWYANVIKEIQVGSYLKSMLVPIVKFTEANAGSRVPGELKLYGDEVLNNMREIVGADTFVRAYSEVKQSIKARKEKRKRGEAVASVADPEKSARKKMRLGLKRKAQKKKKKTRYNR